MSPSRSSLRLLRALCGPVLSMAVGAVAFAADSTPSPDDYLRMAEEVEQVVKKDGLEAWYPHALDTAGGFFCSFTRDWQRDDIQPKTLVFQSRMTWAASRAALRAPSLATTGRARAYSRHGADFLLRMWDGEKGGFYWRLTPPAGAESRPKHAYGIAFAIHALATASRALDDDTLRDKASEAFLWLETHAYDHKNRGYFETMNRNGEPLPPRELSEESSLADLTDLIGVPIQGKSANTHLHMLEACTELLRAWPDPRLRVRLEDLLDLMLTRVFVSPGTQYTVFSADWKPLPRPMSFGFDVETASLLVEAASAVGRSDDRRVWKTARALVDHALLAGWDAKNGGLFNEGAALLGPVGNGEKLWWAQVENLNALLIMHQRFGAETSRYWRCFVEQWRFIRAHCIDPEYHGWYQQVAKDGASALEPVIKGGLWKDPYHESRCLPAVADRLRALAGSPPSFPGPPGP